MLDFTGLIQRDRTPRRIPVKNKVICGEMLAQKCAFVVKSNALDSQQVFHRSKLTCMLKYA